MIAERLAAAGLDWIVPRWEAPAGVHNSSASNR